jgi:hypothetical protein
VKFPSLRRHSEYTTELPNNINAHTEERITNDATLSDMAKFILEINSIKKGSHQFENGRMVKLLLHNENPTIECLTLLYAQKDGVRQKYTTIIEKDEQRKTERLSLAVPHLDLSVSYHNDLASNQEILTNQDGRIISQAETEFVKAAIKNILVHLRSFNEVAVGR